MKTFTYIPSRILKFCLLLLLVGGLIDNSVRAQSIPELMYFKFNSSTGGNVPNDAQVTSRVSASGALNGATVGGAGQFGGALQGNGGATGSNSLNANWATNLSGPWTISLWMKGITNTASNNYIFGGSGGTTFRAFTGTGLVAGGGNIWVRGTGMTDVKINNIFDATGTAVVLHLVYDNTVPEIRVYINGVYSSSQSQTATMTMTGTDFRIGGQASSTGIPNGSLIDEFRMYNRALTATEIAATWNVELNPGPPCPQPTNIAITNLNSTTVDYMWTGVTGSQGYDYVVDQNAAGPTSVPATTTGTAAIEVGLIPSTQYYIHVRNKCTGNGISQWLTMPFMTLDSCTVPDGFSSNVINNNATFSWLPRNTATAYQYLVDQVKASPANASGATLTATANGFASSLAEGQVYYIHIRSLCPGNDSSGWALDSIYVPVKCRVPQVLFNDINSSRAVAYWQAINTATDYEYVLSTSAVQPQFGIRLNNNNNVLLPYLNPGTEYFFHVRSHCSDRGVTSESEWKTYAFSTYALAIDDVKSEGGFLLYPNPVKDRVTFYHKGSEGSAIVYDVNGSAVKVIACTGDSTLIDVSSLPSGMYMLKFNDSSKVVHLSFVK